MNKENFLHSPFDVAKKRKKSRLCLKKNCFKCNQFIEIKWVNAKKNYSQKNSLFYWTEKEENRERYVCSTCLRQWYCNHQTDFRQEVSNLKKIQVFRTYLNINAI